MATTLGFPDINRRRFLVMTSTTSVCFLTRLTDHKESNMSIPAAADNYEQGQQSLDRQLQARGSLPFRFRVLTLNVWGIPTSSDREYRMQAIGKQFADMKLDFVGMQEAILEQDRTTIFNAASAGGLQYSHYFASGIIGSGLFVLSRYPIVDAGFYRFRLSGKPEKILQSDYYAGKGVGFVRIQSPVGLVDLYNIHGIAQYAPDASDEYRAHRSVGMYEAARYLHSQSREYPTIFLGDFNARTDQREYDLVRTLGGLVDCYATVRPSDPGFTITPENPYKKKEQNKRIDHIFVRDGGGIALSPVNAEITMKLIPTLDGETSSQVAYSDHFGVLAEIEANATTMSSLPQVIQDRPTAVRQALTDILDLLRVALTEARNRQTLHGAQAIAGIAVSSGLSLVGKRNRTRRQFLAGLVGGVGSFLAGSYAVVQGWLTLLILPDEVQALVALSSEIEKQVTAHRAFDGTSW